MKFKEFCKKIAKEDLLRKLKIDFKVKGKDLVLSCPFHKETIASLFMDIDSGMFHCFGCEAKGSLVQFVAKIKGISQFDAIKHLEKEYSIRLENQGDWVREVLELKEKSGKEEKEEKKEDIILDEERLENFLKAKNFYMEKRGFDKKMLKKWEVGYDDILKRVVFPVRGEEGKLVGIVGRVVDDKIKPKYINYKSFSKSKFLYGLDKVGKQKEIIVVEGETDVLRMHQYGYQNVIGLFGAQVSEEQIELLIKYAGRSICLMLDNDEAGVLGVDRCVKLAGKRKRLFVAMKYPKGRKDVDECSKKEVSGMLKDKGLVLV